MDLDLFTPVDEDGRSDGPISTTILSGSSVNTFLRCQQQWEYAYVHQLKRPPSIKQGLGIAAHEAVGKANEHKALTFQTMEEEQVVERFLDEWDRISPDIEDVTEETRFSEKTGKPLAKRKETKAQARDSGANAVFAYMEHVGNVIQPVEVEHSIEFILKTEYGDVDWSGILDLTDSDGAVRDQKFVSKRPADGGPYLLPMIGYSLGLRQETGLIEPRFVLDHIVRTQEIQYVPIDSGGPVPDDAIAEFARVALNVKRQIDAGVFIPNGLQSFACSWCGYADICPAYRATHGGRNV